MWAKVSTNIWTTLLLGLSPDAKYLFAYLRLNQHLNMIGLYYLPIVLISHETQLTQERIKKALSDLRQKNLAIYSDATSHVYVPSLAEDHVVKIPKEKKRGRPDTRRAHIQNLLDQCPDRNLSNKFFADYGERFSLKPPNHTNTNIIIEEQKENNEPQVTQKIVDEVKTHKEKINTLIEEYGTDADRVREVIKLLALTRNSGRISDSIVLACLEKWKTIDRRRVMYGINRYIDRSMHLSKKPETYLLAIMRQVTNEELDKAQIFKEKQKPRAITVADKNQNLLEIRAARRAEGGFQ